MKNEFLTLPPGPDLIRVERDIQGIKKKNLSKKLQRNKKNKKQNRKNVKAVLRAKKINRIKKTGGHRETKQNRQDDEESCVEESRYNETREFANMLVNQVRNVNMCLKIKIISLIILYHRSKESSKHLKLIKTKSSTCSHKKNYPISHPNNNSMDISTEKMKKRKRGKSLLILLYCL